jgi:predicted lipoprotein with Yx(FWY)xxD motif
MNHKDRTAQVNQRGRPLDFFVDQFSTKYEEGTSQENKRGRPLDFFVDQF